MVALIEEEEEETADKMCEPVPYHYDVRRQSVTSCPTSIESSPVGSIRQSRRNSFSKHGISSPIVERESCEQITTTSSPLGLSRFKAFSLTKQDNLSSRPVSGLGSFFHDQRTTSVTTSRSESETDTSSVEPVNLLELASSNAPRLAHILRGHWEEAKVIRTHRFRLKRHTLCFSAVEAVDWLVTIGRAPSRQDGVRLMKCLQQHNFIQSITKDTTFADEISLFQFKTPCGRRSSIQFVPSTYSSESNLRRENEPKHSITSSISRHGEAYTVPPVPDWCLLHTLLDLKIRDTDPTFYRSAAVFFSRWLREELMALRLVRSRRPRIDASLTPSCFLGKDAVSFLLRASISVAGREQATSVLQILCDYHLVHSVSDEYTFKDSSAMYRFRKDVKQSQAPQERDVPKKSIEAFAVLPEHVVCFYEVQDDIAHMISSLLETHSRNTSDDDNGPSTYLEAAFAEVLLKTSHCSNMTEVDTVFTRLLHCGLLARCYSFAPAGTLHPDSGGEVYFQLPEASSSEELDDKRWTIDVGVFVMRLYSLWLVANDSEDRDSVSDPFTGAALMHWFRYSASNHLSTIEALSTLGLVYRLKFLTAPATQQQYVDRFAADNTIYCWDVDMIKSVAAIDTASAHAANRRLSNTSIVSVPPIVSPYHDGSASITSSVNNIDVDSTDGVRMSLVDSVNFLKSLSRLTSTTGSVSAVADEEIDVYAKLLCTRWKREKVVKDRRYKLKLYKTCFIGREAVDWLIQEGCAETRRDALSIMRQFDRRGRVCHVCNDHEFRDEMLFYRFHLDVNAKHDGINRKHLPMMEVFEKKSTVQNSPDVVQESSGLSENSFSVLLAGETVCPNQMAIICDVLRLHWRTSRLIHNVRQALHVYHNAFVARDAVAWMVDQGHASYRREAVKIMQALEELGFIHHVLDKHSFTDNTSVFRFRRDESSSNLQVSNKIEGIHAELYQRLCHHSSPVLRERHYHGRQFPSCVTGTQLVDYLVRNHEHFINQRPEAVAFCRDLHSRHIIKHVCDQHPFKDASFFYFFTEDPEWESGPMITNVKRRSDVSISREGSISDAVSLESPQAIAPLCQYSRHRTCPSVSSDPFDSRSPSYGEWPLPNRMASPKRSSHLSNPMKVLRSQSNTAGERRTPLPVRSSSLASLSDPLPQPDIHPRLHSVPSCPPPLPSGSPTGLPPLTSSATTQRKLRKLGGNRPPSRARIDSEGILQSSSESEYLKPLDIQQLLKEGDSSGDSDSDDEHFEQPYSPTGT